MSIRCLLGIHKPMIREEPCEKSYYVSVHCTRCEKLLCRRVICMDVCWVPERESCGFRTGILNLPEGTE